MSELSADKPVATGTKMRQPARHRYAGFTEKTLSDFLDEPVLEDNFLTGALLGV